MTAIVISFAALLFFSRLRLLRRVWRLPLKNGESFFLAQPVVPYFYGGAGAPLFRRYHTAVFVPVVLDAPLDGWLWRDDTSLWHSSRLWRWSPRSSFITSWRCIFQRVQPVFAAIRGDLPACSFRWHRADCATIPFWR